MAQTQTVRVNTRAAKFPYLSRDYGRTVIHQQLDEHNMGLPRFTGSESQHNLGVAQVIYMENVIPVAEGYRSVCYQERDEPCYLTVPGDEPLYIKRLYPREGFLAGGKHTSVALIHGKSFVFNRTTRKLYQAFAGCNAEERTIECLELNKILGITSVGNRMIAYSKDKIYWSNIGADEELDFCPNFTNGSGSAIPTQLKGDIVAVFPLHDKIIIYTTENAVEMHFNNSVYLKYQFHEVPRVGGLMSPLHVAWDSNADYHIALTSNGVQRIKYDRSASFDFQYLYEFLQGDVLEDYKGLQEGISSLSEVPNDLDCESCNWASEVQYGITCLEDSQEHPAQLQERLSEGDCLDVAINFVGSELVVFSYGGIGEGKYEYAITWHEGLQRFGKLKRNHSSVYEARSTYGLDQITFFNDGSSDALRYKHREECEAVIILGRFQLDRNNACSIERIELERIQPNQKLDTYWLHSQDGANWLEDTVPCEVIRADSLRTYSLRKTGKTHAIKLVGTFILTSLLLTFNTNGRR